MKNQRNYIKENMCAIFTGSNYPGLTQLPGEVGNNEKHINVFLAFASACMIKKHHPALAPTLACARNYANFINFYQLLSQQDVEKRKQSFSSWVTNYDVLQHVSKFFCIVFRLLKGLFFFCSFTIIAQQLSAIKIPTREEKSDFVWEK